MWRPETVNELAERDPREAERRAKLKRLPLLFYPCGDARRYGYAGKCLACGTVGAALCSEACQERFFWSCVEW